MGGEGVECCAFGGDLYASVAGLSGGGGRVGRDVDECVLRYYLSQMNGIDGGKLPRFFLVWGRLSWVQSKQA